MYALFERATNATSLYKFKKVMEAMANLQQESGLQIGDQSKWKKYAFDPKVCCDENKTNFIESFNATFGVDRCKLVLTLLEGNPCFKLCCCKH